MCARRRRRRNARAAPEPAQGESGLIRYLAEQKRDGADLNAYANLGTPLLHAIQSGQPKLAEWLLQQGANPLLRVREPGAEGLDGPDALSLAVRVENLQLAARLRAHPAYASLPRSPWRTGCRRPRCKPC